MAEPVYKNPNHFGLVVGIDRYPALGHLNHARADALAFYQWLTDPNGGSVPPKNCKLIVIDDGKYPQDEPDDDDNARRERSIPSLQHLHDAVIRMEKSGDDLYERDRKAWEQSRLYYYVAGHGVAREATDALFLAANTTASYGFHVSCENILKYFLRTKTFRELVLFADCCRTLQPNVVTQLLPFDAGLSRNRRPVPHAVCYGAAFGQQALEPADVDKRRGFFTDALLQGLSGAAASEGEQIDSTNLGVFVGQRVQLLTKKQQKAEIVADPSDPIVFRPAASKPPAAPPLPIGYQVTLTFGAFTGQVQLIGPDASAMGAPQAVAPGFEWILQLPTGLYEVESIPPGALFADKGRFKVVGGDRRVEL